MKDGHVKDGSVFYPPPLQARFQANVESSAWVRQARDAIVAAAAPWHDRSDGELWSLMFGPAITRSWMVWSNGYCPACRTGVPMYTWVIDALHRPWKTMCPHCKEIFPKNNFHAFYRSGLDAQGVFDPARADRSLLVNPEHPDPSDPLHGYGVDDGEGYCEGDKRWRFIGAYLIYGQWKQLIVGGIRNLAAAHVVTGDPAYAHRAMVLLDRVADLHPLFDHVTQAVVYETVRTDGFVSTWHDCCEETREMALAYDQVRCAARRDSGLVAFLADRARAHGLPNRKQSWDQIRQNVEERIFREALRQPHKIHSNYPRTEIAKAVMLAVLDWPGNRAEVLAMVDAMVARASAVDGVTGEKGLPGYTSFTIGGLGVFLAQWVRLDANFLRDLLARQPRLREMYRFHIDTWCCQKYYPSCGDAMWFAAASPGYVGLRFSKDPGLAPSVFTFLWELYRVTGDPAYVQVLHLANDRTLEGLPWDPFADNPESFRQEVAAVIRREGVDLKLPSVNKQEWCLGILRSGQGAAARALWLDYDTTGGHSHGDGMNLGLFGHELDLMPDFGYPPVQFGGWGSPRSLWYHSTAAHNTVVVDGRDQHKLWAGQAFRGATTLWADGQDFHAIRATARSATPVPSELSPEGQPFLRAVFGELTGNERYERTAMLVDIAPGDFYVVDIFQVRGGRDHALFFGSHFGTVTPTGLRLQPVADYGHETEMRQFRQDPAPAPGWQVEWQIEDRYKLRTGAGDLRLRYTGMTPDATAALCEAWVVTGGYDRNEEAWVPRLMIRRQGPAAALQSTFVGVITPFVDTPAVSSIRRLPLLFGDGRPAGEAEVAVEIRHADGGKDLIIVRDGEGSSQARSVTQPEWGVDTDAALTFIRLDAQDRVQRMTLCRGQFVRMGSCEWRLDRPTEFAEKLL